jgi:hypothetical protein
MSPKEENDWYIVLKPENIKSITDLSDYDYFIVHAQDEFNIYHGFQKFKKKNKDFEKIIDLYCIKTHEELRYNNGNWIKLFESQQGQQEDSLTTGFKIQYRKKKEYKINKNQTTPIPLLVYKYFYFSEPETINQKETNQEMVDIKDIQVLYRHGIG